MLSKEQIEQIVQATIAQMNNQQTASRFRTGRCVRRGQRLDV